MSHLEIISLLLPSRQRPHFMDRVWKSALETCEFENKLEIVFVLDDDDKASAIEVKKMATNDPRVKYLIQPRDTNLSRLWNKAYELSTGSILMHLGDDIVFRSNDWDTCVRNEFNKYPDRILFVYGRDGIVDKPVVGKDGQIQTYTSHFGTHGFIHRNWVQTVGYFVPPYFVSDYNDTWLNEVSEKLGRKVFVPEIFTEHMHYTAGKAPVDRNTADRLQRHQETKVDHLYASTEMKQKRQADVDKLAAFISRFKEINSIEFKDEKQYMDKLKSVVSKQRTEQGKLETSELCADEKDICHCSIGHDQKLISCKELEKSLDRCFDEIERSAACESEKEPDGEKQPLADIKSKTNSTKVGFIGVGKLGLPVCIAMGMKGHDVLAYDVNPAVKPGVKAKDLLFTQEEGYGGKSIVELAENHGPKFAESVHEVVQHANLIFVVVQTPHDPKFEGTTRLSAVKERADFNYSYLTSALKTLEDAIDKHNLELELHGVPKTEFTVIVISTVLPGTIRREVMPLLEKNKHIHFGYNPYFIAMGTVIRDFLKPEFILLGMNEKDPSAVDNVEAFYKTLTQRPVYRTTIENAEIIKVRYNTWISMKLVVVNEIMEMCHRTPNADCDQVTDALKMGTDRLVSTAYMTGGLGDGGGCHPRDNIAMSYLCDKLDMHSNLADDIMKAREQQAEFLNNLIREQHVAHKELPVVILGTAFKAETNISTGSPTLLMCSMLKEGNPVPFVTFDPYIDARLGDTFAGAYCESYYRGLLDQDKPRLYFLGCKHKCFQSLTFPKDSVVIDPFRYLKPEQKIGIHVISVGIGPSLS